MSKNRISMLANSFANFKNPLVNDPFFKIDEGGSSHLEMEHSRLVDGKIVATNPEALSPI